MSEKWFSDIISSWRRNMLSCGYLDKNTINRSVVIPSIQTSIEKKRYALPEEPIMKSITEYNCFSDTFLTGDISTFTFRSTDIVLLYGFITEKEESYIYMYLSSNQMVFVKCKDEDEQSTLFCNILDEMGVDDLDIKEAEKLLVYINFSHVSHISATTNTIAMSLSQSKDILNYPPTMSEELMGRIREYMNMFLEDNGDFVTLCDIESS